jgi:hypothetical protein
VGFVELNLRTFSGVPAWSNVQARMVGGITDMMVYAAFEEVYVRRSMGMLVLLLLRNEVEEDAS